jgi:plastocyanin
MPRRQSSRRWGLFSIMSTNLLSSIFTLASAQSSSSTATPTTSSASTSATSTPKVHTVEVGPGGQFGYVPNNLTADVGDIVSFLFYPTNHSVVRGEYFSNCGSANCNPCVPREMYGLQNGFHSDNILTQSVPIDGKVSPFASLFSSTTTNWRHARTGRAEALPS